MAKVKSAAERIKEAEAEGYAPGVYVIAHGVTLADRKEGVALYKVSTATRTAVEGDATYLQRRPGFAEVTPGLCYEIPVKGDSFRVGLKHFVGSFNDVKLLEGWNLVHEEWMGKRRAEAFFKSEKGKAAERALSAMDGLRRAYARADPWGRRIMEARLLQYLRSPPS